MRKLLLNPTPLFRKLRQLSMLLTLLLALPQTAWGKRYTTTGYDVIDATGNDAGTRFTWNTNATGTSTTWRWVIDCEAGTVTPGSTLTFTLPAGKNITLSIDGYANDMSTVDTESLRKLILDGLSNDLTVSAYLRKGSNQYNFIGSNGVFTPNNWTESMSTDGAVNITITNNSGKSVTCTINSITVLTGQIISSNGLAWPAVSPIDELTKSVSNNVTTLSGSCAVDTYYSFPLKRNEGNSTLSTLTEQYDIAYSSSNPSVAEVSDAGFVTIKGSGSTIITATLTENDYYSYAQSTYSYTLTNTETYGLTIAGTAVTSANASAITGSGISGTVSFDANNKILTLNGATIDGTIESSLAILSIHLTGTNLIRGNTATLLNGIKSTNGGTLTFTADASSTLHITTTGDAASAITGFANVTMGTGAYLQTDTPTKYDTNGKNFCLQVSSANIVKELNITSTPSYPLWIGNTQFTSAGTSIPTGFSFNATGNILTLTNVTQTDPLISGLANLTIALSGDNSIIRSDSAAVIRSINSQAALIIQKAGTGDGSLYLENNGSDPSASPVVKNFASINHTGLNYSSRSGSSINGASTHDAILSSATIYPLWIAASKPVTATTTSGTGWSYDAANNKLSLNNATINGSIISGLGDLTIDIQGTNTISVSDTASVIRSTSAGKLTITKTGTTASLQLNNTRQSSYHSPIIKDFASFELAEGLYLSNAKAYGNEEVPAVYEAFTNVSQNGGNSTMGLINPTLLSSGDKGIRIVKISTEENYPIWVAHHRASVGSGYNVVYNQITRTNKGDFLGDNVPKVSFIPASTGNGNVNTLVLNGAAITDAIISNLANLTIEFSGTNTLCEDGGTSGYIHSSNPNAIITFKSVADNSSISLKCANEHAVVEGFANVAFDNAVAEYSGSFSYNTTERRYKNDYGALQLLTIKAPTATDISSYFQGQNNYGTYYNTTNNYTIPAGMEAYVITGVSGNQVVLKSLSVLPKQTALLLFKGTATSFNSVTTNESADTSGNILMHADATVTTTGKEYILYKDEFVKATETIPSGKCYLQITTNLPARGVLGIGNDGSTAIEGIDVEATEDETWYDLQGRRIQKPTKAGIYIVNGKKMIINNK